MEEEIEGKKAIKETADTEKKERQSDSVPTVEKQEEERRFKKKRKIIIIATMLIYLLIQGVFGYIAITRGDQGQSDTTPPSKFLIIVVSITVVVIIITAFVINKIREKNNRG